MDFAALAELCAPNIGPGTLERIAAVESSFNPYAIGVVRGRLQRQPRNHAEAVATARSLEDEGYDYSAGLVQINRSNFGRFGLTHESVFDPCINLRVGASIFHDCFKRAGSSPTQIGDALSCYYSGNFKTGYRHGYVDKVLKAGAGSPGPEGRGAIKVVPDTHPKSSQTGQVRKANPVPTPLLVTVALAPDMEAASAAESSKTQENQESALLF